jgi:hypothetical protein
VDPITRNAFRTPMFLAGVLMLLVGLVPVAVALVSGWDRVAGVTILSAFAPVGAVLMAVARAKVAERWKKGR